MAVFGFFFAFGGTYGVFAMESPAGPNLSPSYATAGYPYFLECGRDARNWFNNDFLFSE